MGENPTFMFEYGRSQNMEGRYAESFDIMLSAARWCLLAMRHRRSGINIEKRFGGMKNVLYIAITFYV
jgi:hypothetical protein